MNMQVHKELSYSNAKQLVNDIDRFLHHGDKSKFNDLFHAVNEMKDFHSRLTFLDDTCLHFQSGNLRVYEMILSEEYKGFDADYALHSCNGYFNQTYRDATNIPKDEIHYTFKLGDEIFSDTVESNSIYKVERMVKQKMKDLQKNDVLNRKTHGMCLTNLTQNN